MPYYLVSQVSVDEAEDEVAAARKALRQIRNADSVSFSVKLDEQTVEQVSISEPRMESREQSAEPTSLASTTAVSDSMLAVSEPSIAPLRRGLLSSVALVATGVMVGATWSYWIA